jgi:hypothetical protein
MVQSHGAPADRATGHQSPRPESNRLPARYKLAALPGELQGHRVPGAIRTRTADLLGIVTPTHLVYEDMEPPPGVEPGLPPYGGRAASRAQRLGWGTRARTWTLLLQRQACCLVTPLPIDTRTGFEPADGEIWTRQLCESVFVAKVRREGFEPPSTGLRGQRSSGLSLPAHGAPPGN